MHLTFLTFTNGLILLSQDIPDWFTTLDDLNPGFGGGKNLQRGYSNAGSKGGGRQSSDSTGYGGYNAGGGYKQQQVLFIH